MSCAPCEGQSGTGTGCSFVLLWTLAFALLPLRLSRLSYRVRERASEREDEGGAEGNYRGVRPPTNDSTHAKGVVLKQSRATTLDSDVSQKQRQAHQMHSWHRQNQAAAVRCVSLFDTLVTSISDKAQLFVQSVAAQDHATVDAWQPSLQLLTRDCQSCGQVFAVGQTCRRTPPPFQSDEGAGTTTTSAPHTPLTPRIRG